MKIFSNIVLALALSAAASSALAQQEAVGNRVLVNDNMSTAVGGVGGGIGGAGTTGACATSRIYSNGVVSGTDCTFLPPTAKVDTAPCAKIVQVVRKGACTAAAEDLAVLRSGSLSYKFFTASFRKEMAVAGLTLEDFKMSEAKLRELQVLGAKHSAKQLLKQLREGTSSYEFFMRNLREELKAGGLTPEDIGSDDFELADISQNKK